MDEIARGEPLKEPVPSTAVVSTCLDAGPEFKCTHGICRSLNSGDLT